MTYQMHTFFLSSCSCYRRGGAGGRNYVVHSISPIVMLVRAMKWHWPYNIPGTSWASHKRVWTSDWPCPHQFFGSCTNRRIEFRPSFLYFIFRDMIDLTIKKKPKRPKFVKTKKQKPYGRHSIPLNVRFKDELKNSDRNSQNWAWHRSINNATFPITTSFMYRNRFGLYLVMGDELGSATDIDRLLVSSGLSTPYFTLIGKDDFWSCHTRFLLSSH